MQQNRAGWEGTIVAFAIIFSVLIGVAYTIAWSYRLTVPWLALMIIALVAALGLRLRRR